METDEFKYDIAFSFLSKDEDTAQQINDLLSDRCRTFIYADKQKEIAFTDGEETFKRVFSKDARIVAVLFRPEWGNTKWTRIEEEGIRGRAYNQGYDFSTFVSMTERVELPDWLPPTLLFSLPRFVSKGLPRREKRGFWIEAAPSIQRPSLRGASGSSDQRRLSKKPEFSEKAKLVSKLQQPRSKISFRNWVGSRQN